jgi:hypothetical protein
VVAARGRGASSGYSAIELLFAVAILLTIGAAAIPQTLVAVDRHRLLGGVRYVSGRLQQARLEAIVRSADVGLLFTASSDGFVVTAYVDGNGNGVRTADVQSGVDRPIDSGVRLPDMFPDVDFGLQPGLPPVEPGSAAPGGDPIKLGASDILTFSPFGTSSSGSLYVRGPGIRQAVIRVFGTTGKTRALEFDSGTRTWNPI